jgi:DeoR/GlpR family transcriptional regulator of sugar metabolism
MSRRTDIVNHLQDRGFQSVSALAQAFGVDASTIRRDLDKLEAEGIVERTHGGAVPVDPRHSSAGAGAQHQAEKAAIGAAMAERVHEGQTIMLDTGETTLEVARHLRHSRLTVVTHDLRVGLEIATKPSINLVFVGGELLPSGFGMWGPTSVQQVENLRVNVAIFGAGTVMDDGIYSASSYEIELKRKMRSIANEAFFVADSSKFGREALFKVFGFEDFTAGITDSMLDPIRAAALPVPVIRVAVGAAQSGRDGGLASHRKSVRPQRGGRRNQSPSDANGSVVARS